MVITSSIWFVGTFPPESLYASITIVVLFGCLWYAYEQQQSAWITASTAVMLALFVGLALPEPYVTQQVSPSLFLPVVVALIMSTRPVVCICIVLPLTIVLVRAGGIGAHRDLQFLAVYSLTMLGMVLNHALAMWALEEVTAVNRDLDQLVTARTVDLQGALSQVSDLLADRERLMTVRADAMLELAHDLANYMQYVGGSVDTLALSYEDEQAGLPLDDDMRVPAQIAGTQAMVQRTVRFVAEIRDAALLESHALPLHIQPIALDSLLQQVILPLRQAFQREAVMLTLEPPPESLLVRADPDYLARVLENVLGNALRYTRSARSDGAVTVTVDQQRDLVAILVQDNGEGIAPEKLAQLGERFVRVTEGREGGSGIGLHFCIAVLAAMGGRLTMESPGLGQGTTTAIGLSLAQEQIS